MGCQYLSHQLLEDYLGFTSNPQELEDLAVWCDESGKPQFFRGWTDFMHNIEVSPLFCMPSALLRVEWQILET